MQLPNGLLASVRDGQCVAVVGSGLSVPAGLPSWRQLLTALIEEGQNSGLIEDRKRLRQEVAEHRYLEVAEYVRRRLGASLYYKVLRRAIAVSAEPTANHKLLVTTPYRGMITTNYDKILETAYTLKWRRPPRTLSWSEPESLGTVLFDKEFFIFKLHGDIDKPDSLVLTRRDYDELMFRSPHIRTLLQAVLLSHNLFFVGYSLSDPDFQNVMAEIPLIFRGTTPMSYALLPELSRAASENLMRLNIQVVTYDPHDDHVEVTRALELLRKAAAGVQRKHRV